MERNLTGTSLVGLKLSAAWSKRYRKEDGNYYDWLTHQKKKEFSFTGTFLSGYWNSVKLILPDTKPSEFGFLEITAATDAVKMPTATITQ